MKRILVTGGAGFLGGNLCKRLLDEGNFVICLDNFFTGHRNNIELLLENPCFRVIAHDITNTSIPIELKIPEGVDEIYNLACPASPPHYQFDKIETVKANTLGVINVLEYAKICNAKIFQASTSEIYGDPLEHPQKESYRGNVNTLGPRACYDEGKRIAETLFMDYHRKYGLKIRIARIFNTYGPNMDHNDGRVVSNFIVQAIRKEPITIYGNGEQTRSFCYVDDLIEGFLLLMNSDFIGPVNLGNPQEFTMNQLAKKVKEITKSSSEVIYKDLPQDDPKMRRPDISLAKKEINWEPKVMLEEGLKKTIEYFREKIS